jgi:uncharacterized membrane protein YcaP (DUF421 family)
MEQLFGLHATNLQTSQMIARAIFVFLSALLLIRIAGVRSLGKQTVFDHLTTIMMGAMLGRAIVAVEQPFFGSLATVAVIMLLHRLIAWITFLSKKAGMLFKGESILLIKNGRRHYSNMQKTNITMEDITEALRRYAGSANLDEIKEVHLERSGEISFVKKETA